MDQSQKENLQECLHGAREALKAGDAARAGALLAPWVEETRHVPELALVWVKLLETVDEGRQLARELRRLSSDWSESRELHAAMARAAIAWSRRHREQWESRPLPCVGEDLLSAPDQLMALLTVFQVH